MNSGVSLEDNTNKLDIYLKNVVVACVSAKIKNPKDEVSFVTNISICDLPKKFKEILSDNFVTIREVKFDRFRFPSNYKWSLAFYKLCVLSYLVKLEFDQICYLDADIYVQRDFKFIWEECKKKILLYDINDGLNVNSYQTFCREVSAFTGQDIYPTRFGGEFFAASKKLAIEFIEIMDGVYNKMLTSSFECTTGDEFIINVAALECYDQIKNAGAYIYRFWTGIKFNQISTCYKNPSVAVLHFPAEKKRGMLRLYHRFYLKGKKPTNKAVWRVCRLSYSPFLDRCKRLIVQLVPKLNDKDKFLL